MYGKINWGQVRHPLYRGCLLFGGSVFLYTIDKGLGKKHGQHFISMVASDAENSSMPFKVSVSF